MCYVSRGVAVCGYVNLKWPHRDGVMGSPGLPVMGHLRAGGDGPSPAQEVGVTPVGSSVTVSGMEELSRRTMAGGADWWVLPIRLIAHFLH